MTEDDRVRLGGRGKCNPPVRAATKVERLWRCLPDGRGLSPTGMARCCAERGVRPHGLLPAKGTPRPCADCGLLILRRGDFTFDEAAIIDRPEPRWPPWHRRAMRARVAARVPRGRVIWDGATVLSVPGFGEFVPRSQR